MVQFSKLIGFGEEYPFALILWNCEWKSNGLKFSQDIFYFHVKIKEKFDVLKEIYAKQFIPYKMVKGGQWGSKDIICMKMHKKTANYPRQHAILSCVIFIC